MINSQNNRTWYSTSSIAKIGFRIEDSPLVCLLVFSSRFEIIVHVRHRRRVLQIMGVQEPAGNSGLVDHMVVFSFCV